MTATLKPNSIIRWYRGLKAYLCPMQFMRWVNSERCYIMVRNNPSGGWSVQLGVAFGTGEAAYKSLRLAMWKAYWATERDPEWCWTTEYLASI